VAGVGYKTARNGRIGSYSTHGSKSVGVNRMQRNHPFQILIVVHLEDEEALEAELQWIRYFADVLDTSGVPAEIVKSHIEIILTVTGMI
jgi:hypothetical protein